MEIEEYALGLSMRKHIDIAKELHDQKARMRRYDAPCTACCVQSASPTSSLAFVISNDFRAGHQSV